MENEEILNLSKYLSRHGVKRAVLSPGSRNAPLIISFARNPNFKKWIIPDERSAGFIALGMAQYCNEPAVLCCTSGTALLNYYPAIAEAYYREIPLIVISADRPSRLIGQRDGQTIQQFDIFKNHIKNSYNYTKGNFYKLIQNIVTTSINLPKGPIHLNIPIEEPLYVESVKQLVFDPSSQPSCLPISSYKFENKDIDRLIFGNKQKKILVLIGQQKFDSSVSKAIENIDQHIPIIGTPLNNIRTNYSIKYVDLFIDSQEELQADILITAGLFVLSKNLKNFIRKFPPKKHYHIDPAGVYVDTYCTKPTIIKNKIDVVLKDLETKNIDGDYLKKWRNYHNIAEKSISKYIPKLSYSEIAVGHFILKNLPENIELHLSNSTSVRLADIFGICQSMQIWCNRGTSGIDGCTSTALGSSLISDKLNLLLTGDTSFFYDRNAFFHNYILNNFKIVILNNRGGGIFRLIDGMDELPELEKYFEIRHQFSAYHLCMEHGFEYFSVKNWKELENNFRLFLKPSQKVGILEIFTQPEVNQSAYKNFKNNIKNEINLQVGVHQKI